MRVEIEQWIKTLLKEGLELIRELKNDNNTYFKSGYQTWYTRALSIVSQLIPERLNEFKNLYDNKDETSDIAGYILGYADKSHVYNKFVLQYYILESAKTRLYDKFTNIYGFVQSNILDSEINVATELLKAGHLRASGTLAGVVLERYLANVVSSRSLKTNKKNPTIAYWNDILKDSEVYDIPTWRSIQYLADIRNLCAHAKDREPTKDEVDELIRGVVRIIKMNI